MSQGTSHQNEDSGDESVRKKRKIKYSLQKMLSIKQESVRTSLFSGPQDICFGLNFSKEVGLGIGL